MAHIELGNTTQDKFEDTLNELDESVKELSKISHTTDHQLEKLIDIVRGQQVAQDKFDDNIMAALDALFKGVTATRDENDELRKKIFHHDIIIAVMSAVIIALIGISMFFSTNYQRIDNPESADTAIETTVEE